MSSVARIGAIALRYRCRSLTTNTPKGVQLLSDSIAANTVWQMSSFQFSSLDELKVELNDKKHQFFIQMGKEKAVLDFKEVRPGVLDMYHTGVPKELQGRSVGKLLAKEAFDYAVKNKKKMILSCTYLQKYLKDNPKKEYMEAVVKS